MNQDIIDFANACDVDPAAVEMMAKMVISRLQNWDAEPDQDIIEAAVIDIRMALKRMAVKSHMNPQAFADAVLGAL